MRDEPTAEDIEVDGVVGGGRGGRARLRLGRSGKYDEAAKGSNGDFHVDIYLTSLQERNKNLQRETKNFIFLLPNFSIDPYDVLYPSFSHAHNIYYRGTAKLRVVYRVRQKFDS